MSPRYQARGLRIPLRSAFESKPSRNQGNQRKNFTFTLFDKQGVNCSTHRLFASRPSCLMKAVCSATSRCAPMPSPQTLRTLLANCPSLRHRRSSGCQWCSLCPKCHLLQLPCCKGSESDSQQRKTSLAAFTATLQQQTLSTVAAPLP